MQIFLAWDWPEPEHRITFHFLYKCKPTEPVGFLFWIQGTHWFFGQCVRLFAFHESKTLKAIQLFHLHVFKSLLSASCILLVVLTEKNKCLPQDNERKVFKHRGIALNWYMISWAFWDIYIYIMP